MRRLLRIAANVAHINWSIWFLITHVIELILSCDKFFCGTLPTTIFYFFPESVRDVTSRNQGLFSSESGEPSKEPGTRLTRSIHKEREIIWQQQIVVSGQNWFTRFKIGRKFRSNYEVLKKLSKSYLGGKTLRLLWTILLILAKKMSTLWCIWMD